MHVSFAWRGDTGLSGSWRAIIDAEEKVGVPERETV
jgi:hypothetical protein